MKIEEEERSEVEEVEVGQNRWGEDEEFGHHQPIDEEEDEETIVGVGLPSYA